MKKTKTRAVPKNFDVKYFGEEPTWTDNPTPSQSDIGRAFNWYNYFNDWKSSAKLLVDNYPRDNKEELKILKNLPTYSISPTLGYMARMMYMGCKFSDEQLIKWNTEIEELLSKTKKEQKQEKVIETKKPVSIQDRTREKVNETLGEIEGEIDDFIRGGYKSKFSMYQWLQTNEIKPLYCKHIQEIYQEMLDELLIAKNKEDEQVVEAYSFMKKVQLNRFIKFLEDIINDAGIWASNTKKSRKPRKKKNVAPNKKIEKLQYMKSFNELKLFSFSPEDILGAKELITYNVKYKKLNYYYSASLDGFSIKGTTLQNFSEKSFTKRLRKPEEVLTSIQDCGKIALRKMIKGIKTKEMEAKGRINNDTILLKVFK